MSLRAPLQASLKSTTATLIPKAFRLPFNLTDQRNIRNAVAARAHGHRRSPCSARIMNVICNHTPQPLDQKEATDEAGQPSGYRQNVGVCLLHPSGKVFAARCGYFELAHADLSLVNMQLSTCFYAG